MQSMQSMTYTHNVAAWLCPTPTHLQIAAAVEKVTQVVVAHANRLLDELVFVGDEVCVELVLQLCCTLLRLLHPCSVYGLYTSFDSYNHQYRTCLAVLTHQPAGAGCPWCSCSAPCPSSVPMVDTIL